MNIDKKSLGKGHKYFTLVYVLRKATAEYLADDLWEESLYGYYRLVWLKQRRLRLKLQRFATRIWPRFGSICLEEDKQVFHR